MLLTLRRMPSLPPLMPSPEASKLSVYVRHCGGGVGTLYACTFAGNSATVLMTFLVPEEQLRVTPGCTLQTCPSLACILHLIISA